MGRYLGSVCRQCKKVSNKLFLKGERCSTKCPLDKKKKDTRFVKKKSEYGTRLTEKQKARFAAFINEKQFHNLYKQAKKMPGSSGENLLLLLETRLDNVVKRMGFAQSIIAARQMISHGNVKVNNRNLKVPAYRVKAGDKIIINEKIKVNISIKRWLDNYTRIPSWLVVNKDSFSGEVVSMPTREEMSYPVDERLIVELYSR
ncbi:MAG: 30S ribosomal protein S4 [Elusimicrobia bacterium RIFOXYA2_FULL_39_19]|nr:MAG: 30S ribosomal protein S4 [Elusimicrobia bacterium RIFOXYA2_FULL_39_19]